MTPQEIATAIVKTFNRFASKQMYEAIYDILLSNGFSKSDALEVSESYANTVYSCLRNDKTYPLQSLPFDFNVRGKNIQLVGKSRVRKTDRPETEYARNVSQFIPELRNALIELDDKDFETLCAASLRLAGASEAFALRGHDEGGIDFFGRFPIRNQSEHIPESLLRTTLINFPLLILGQAKCNAIGNIIGRPEIQKFTEQVKECIEKYRNIKDPPTMRVPDIYYLEREPFLPIFITTSSFSDRVPGTAFANGIYLIDGNKLSEFLLANKIGIISCSNGVLFSKENLLEWVKNQINLCTYRK